ncbi:MAG TPA: 5-methyltetrahydropteroyltriglutamate--homocysteine S-methyltransferase [Actinomycetes bacterium]|nr:5-methyltetrahydropteroyltriglutamate--homocysteine S-methyltransferase [Actinomycetes bacterium]
MAIATNLGFPRIGVRRELKWALERYWNGEIGHDELEETAQRLRRSAWELQRAIGIEHVPSGDFSLYDHVLDTAVTVGAIPRRFGSGAPSGLDTYFAMARGGLLGGRDVQPCRLNRWFDTSYHHLVPELDDGQRFARTSNRLVEQYREAAALGVPTRPVLLGPVSFLLLSKGEVRGSRRLELLRGLVEVYAGLLVDLAAEGADWVQLDEPCLAADIPADAHVAYMIAYHRLARAAKLNLLVATYFSGLRGNLATALRLPVAGLHVDLTREPDQLAALLQAVPERLSLSLGVIDGRNVWRADLDTALDLLERAADRIGTDRVLVAPSCSLLHVPIDLDLEAGLDPELRSWLSFAVQKLEEVEVLARALNEGRGAVDGELAEARDILQARRRSPRVHDPAVARRLSSLRSEDYRRRLPYRERRLLQASSLPLPPLPTTTIGSFPQTPEVRAVRFRYRRGEIDRHAYEQRVWAEVERTLRLQEELGLDVLVHGEFERSDMIEHFGEGLEGFALTRHGWVQRHGSDCARPPIVFGDVSRRGPMTVEWTRQAQARTQRPVKAILTGPVTMLRRSFARDDQPPEVTCTQIALAIRDEVVDLQAAGIRIIQLDEPALPVGLPPHHTDAGAYLDWAVGTFRLASCGARDETQIHVHVCDGDVDELMEVLEALDADVLSFEAARSDMAVLRALEQVGYRNELGPGVVDARSGHVPTTADILARLRAVLDVLHPEQVWVNPDRGLGARAWDEVVAALTNMVEAARTARADPRVVTGQRPQPHLSA